MKYELGDVRLVRSAFVVGEISLEAEQGLAASEATDVEAELGSELRGCCLAQDKGCHGSWFKLYMGFRWLAVYWNSKFRNGISI